MTAAGTDPVPFRLLVIVSSAISGPARVCRLPHLGRAALLSSGQVGHIVAREKITGEVGMVITGGFY